MLRAVLLTVSLTLSLAVRADDPVFSGPQPGEKLTPFKVQNVLGASAGKEIEVLGEIKGGPCLLIFVHEWTRPTLQLVRPLDIYAAKWAGDGLATRIIMLGADRQKAEQFLQGAKNSLALKSIADVSLDGQEGPGNYGLNRKMTVTILVAKENKVVANFAIIQPNETDAPKVLAAVAKMLGKTAPTAEEIRAEVGQGGRRPQAANNPDPELGQLMRRMIQKDNDEATVKEIMQAMQKWAGDDAPKKAQLKEYCKKVLDLGYGNDLAKRALKRLAGE
jgi:hypothetical protein